MLDERRRREIRKKIQRENRDTFIKGTIILLTVGLIVYGTYWYHTTIFDPVRVKGYCYSSELVQVESYSRLQLHYHYYFKGKRYDHLETEIFSNSFRQGDSLLIEISESDPNFHYVLGLTNVREENIYYPHY